MPLTIKPSSGSGSSTLISVAGTTTNDTLTLPAKTGNIITSADSGTVTGTMLASATVSGSNLTTGGPSWNSNGAVALLNGVTNATGTGITFPATQSASSDVNTLDDYEEGTWSPTITAVGASNPTVTYSNQKGFYTKIGNRVYYNLYLTWTAYSGGSANTAAITLPFSSSSVSGNFLAAYIGYSAGVTGNPSQCYGDAGRADTFMIKNNTGSTQVLTNDFSASGTLIMAGHYIAA